MRKFNLQEALEGKLVVTRLGEPVTQLHKFLLDDHTYTIFGVHGGTVESWSDAGRFFGDTVHNSDLDLFMEGE